MVSNCGNSSGHQWALVGGLLVSVLLCACGDLVFCIAFGAAECQVNRRPMHLGGVLNESYVSDSDSQSILAGSQSALILPSSYSFDQVRILHFFFTLCWCELCNNQSACSSSGKLWLLRFYIW